MVWRQGGNLAGGGREEIAFVELVWVCHSHLAFQTLDLLDCPRRRLRAFKSVVTSMRDRSHA